MSTQPAPSGVESGPAQSPATDVRGAPVYARSRSVLLQALRRAGSIATLIALDVLGLAIGLYLALLVRALIYGDTLFWNIFWRDNAGEWLPFLAPITILVFFQGGLYGVRERRPGIGRILSSLVLVACIVLAFGIGTGYDFATSGLIPTAVVTTAATIGLLRLAYGSAALELMRAVGIRRRVLLVGGDASVERVHRQLAAAVGGVPYELIGVVSESGSTSLSAPSWGFGDLALALSEARPDELVLTESDFEERALLRAVELAHRSGVVVKLAPSTTELLVHEGEYVPGQGAPLFEVRAPVLTGMQFLLKRVFDLVLAGLGAVAGLPLWLAVALAIKLESRGPVFYVDPRVGVGQREFGMLKFRTMVAGAAALQDDLEELNEASGALFKIRDDPRVTRVGRVLRRLSIDELPQLLNVLRGQMSLVGPRPLPLRDHARLEDWHKARYNVLPGMTGLWQISGRSGLSFDDLVRLDFTYLENWSVWQDVTIIVKTLPAVVSRRGAY